MMGKLRFYLITGIAGFVFTFIFSIRNNLWMTSMYRALIACAIWFLLAFLLNWMFAAITGPRAAEKGTQARSGSRTEEPFLTYPRLTRIGN